jgi:tetratricopeptide (TPR) repeat protein
MPPNKTSIKLDKTALIELKRHEESIESFNKSIELNPSYSYTYYFKGIALKIDKYIKKKYSI